MYKFMYFSIKAQKIVVVMFAYAKDCADFFYKNHDDIDLGDHFAKIIKE